MHWKVRSPCRPSWTAATPLVGGDFPHQDFGAWQRHIAETHGIALEQTVAVGDGAAAALGAAALAHATGAALVPEEGVEGVGHLLEVLVESAGDADEVGPVERLGHLGGHGLERLLQRPAQAGLGQDPLELAGDRVAGQVEEGQNGDAGHRLDRWR